MNPILVGGGKDNPSVVVCSLRRSNESIYFEKENNKLYRLQSLVQFLVHVYMDMNVSLRVTFSKAVVLEDSDRL